MQLNNHCMINRGKFKECYSDFDKDIVLDILDMFINDYGERIKKLSGYINDRAPSFLKREAHAFKSIIGNIETDCIVFAQLELIEGISSELLDAVEKDEKLSDEAENRKYNEIIEQFQQFKISSSQLLAEAKELRLQYLGE